MNTTFLIFGLTGDLMKKKGIPALFALWKDKKLPEDFRVVGFSRKVWTKEKIAKHISDSIEVEAPQEFADLFSIYTGEGEDQAAVINLKKEFNLSHEKLFIYLCVSPELYAKIISNLAGANLLGGSRILIEKPFGSDLASAQSLQKLLLQHTTEEQIYRIDHFLAKEAMMNLAELQHQEITSIEVYLNESLGVEKRGAMYDPVGAFRDVGQNHLLEAAAAVLGNRAQVLDELHILTSDGIKTETVRGQYEGYSAIDGVAPGSQTETYFKVKSHFTHRGREISLLLESGKRLLWHREVIVTLSNGESRVIPFESGTNEYEILFSEAFAGNRTRFVSMREVEALWRFTDPIEKEWHANTPPLFLYPPDTEIS